MACTVVGSLLIVGSYSATSWHYGDTDHGISDWDDLYPECGYSRQSPINIEITDDLSNCESPLLLDWESQTEHFAIRNNGHSLQAIPFEITHEGGSDLSGLEVLHHTNDSVIRLKNSFYNTYRSRINTEYCFDSLHFHWGIDNEFGSEHTINGQHYPLEMHLVHYSCDYYVSGDAINAYSNGELSEKYDDDNALAVIGVIFEIGEANPVLDQILSDMIIDGIYQYHDPEDVDENLLELHYAEFDMIDLLPSNKEMIAYEGSLTTPPCFETVRWHLMKDTVTVSEEQMEQFRSLLGSTDINDTMAPNFRPIQDINDRVIYHCQETVDADIVEKNELTISDDGAENQSENDDVTWFIIGIVFICLFGAAMLVIGCLCHTISKIKSNHEKLDNDKKSKYESVKANDVEAAQLQNSNYH